MFSRNKNHPLEDVLQLTHLRCKQCGCFHTTSPQTDGHSGTLENFHKACTRLPGCASLGQCSEGCRVFDGTGTGCFSQIFLGFSIHLFFFTFCWFFVNFISCTPNPLISLSLAFATPPTKKKRKNPCNGSCSVSVCHTALLLYTHLSMQMSTAMSYWPGLGLCHPPRQDSISKSWRQVCG